MLIEIMFLISEVIINKQIIWVVLPHCCFKQISGVRLNLLKFVKFIISMKDDLF